MVFGWSHATGVSCFLWTFIILLGAWTLISICGAYAEIYYWGRLTLNYHLTLPSPVFITLFLFYLLLFASTLRVSLMLTESHAAGWINSFAFFVTLGWGWVRFRGIPSYVHRSLISEAFLYLSDGWGASSRLGQLLSITCEFVINNMTYVSPTRGCFQW